MQPPPQIQAHSVVPLRFLAVLLTAGLIGLGAAPVASGNPGQSDGREAEARRLYGFALSLIAAGDAEAGANELRLVAEHYSGSDLADDALLGLVQLHMRAGDSAAATEAAEWLVESYPGSDSAAGGNVLLAELRREVAVGIDEIVALRVGVLRTATLYSRDAFPGLPWRAAANVVAGELTLELGDATAAAGYFGLALHDAVLPEWEQRARIGLARALLVSDDWSAAAQVLQPVAAAIEDGGSAARAAHQLMSLIHRTRIRTLEGGSAWVAGRTIRSAGSAFDRPTGVAASLYGHVLVADEGVPFVVGLDAAGEVQWQQKPMNSRGHPWFDRAGTAFFPTEASVIEAATRQRHTFAVRLGNKDEPVEKIIAGARGMFGEWILVHDNGKRVSVFDREGRFVRSQMPDGSDQVTDVAVDQQGRIYLLDRRGSRVFRYSGAGQMLGFAARGAWKRAEALALDALGRVYVLDRDEKRIEVFDAHGQRIAELGPVLPGGITLDDPRDLAVDASGRLFIADRRLKAIVVLE